MAGLRGRTLPLVGMLGLAGLGALLVAGGRGEAAPHLPLPILFTVLVLVAAVALALVGPRSRRAEPDLPIWRALALLALAVLLGVGLGFVRYGSRAPGPVPDHSAALDDLVVRAEAVAAAVDAWWPAADAAAEAAVAGVTPDAPRRGGDLFRSLADWPRLWDEAGTGFAAGMVLWRGGDRLAWNGDVLPLPRQWPDRVVPAVPEWRRRLVETSAGWILRQAAHRADGLVVELQVRLTPGGSAEIAPGVEMIVGPVNDPALTMDDAGVLIRQVGFGPDGAGPYAHLLARPEPPAVRRGVVRARLMLAALAAWALALSLAARVLGGRWSALAALWAARAVLAEIEALRWVGAALPDRMFPTAPGDPVSLVDPAYFASTYLRGWFASTADALISVAVVAITVWTVLAARGLLGGASGDEAPRRRPLFAPHIGGGLLFGAVAGILLLGLADFAGLLAENANSRLIGTGVSPGALVFWGLQLVLMVLAFALTGLLAGLAAPGRWPSAAGRTGWVGGGLLAAAVAVGLGEITGDAWWASRLLAALVTAGLWVAAPMLGARPLFLRRFAWPLILLLATSWNYAALRDVYDAAERDWLEQRGRQITQVDAGWQRALLGRILPDMVERDRDLAIAGDDLWRDEAAWTLYHDSALSDLGWQCAVEILGPDGTEQSFFALGFMGADGYEIAAREPWVDLAGDQAGPESAMIFRLERRRYPGGEEEILSAEVRRERERGWLRVEIPLRSWRVATLTASIAGGGDFDGNGYRPRTEVDRPVLLMLADDTGWLDTGTVEAPGPAADLALAQLRRGERDWARIAADDQQWLCMWRPLPADYARRPGEGFLLGLRQPGLRDNALDLSRLMLLNLLLFFVLFGVVRLRRWVLLGGAQAAAPWRPGFQERFLGGYLVLGLVLLVVVGTSVDRVGHERVRSEAQARTRAGLTLAVDQLRSLLTEQAGSLVNSDYIDGLMRGRLAGDRPVGSEDVRQGMVFAGDGTLLLDETLSDLGEDEARALLAAGRVSPMVVVRDAGMVFLGVVVPIELGDWLPPAPGEPGAGAAGAGGSNGYFFFRQRLDKSLVQGLAELVSGEVVLDVAGRPLLASHPEAVFAGEVPLLAAPDRMMPLLDHRAGMSVFAAPDRPFAFTAGRPLAALSRDRTGRLGPDVHPAVLNVAFPDREREYAAQRNATVLFLAGLANLILLTALILALLLSWNIFRPLRVLLTATRSLAQGDFGAPLPEAGRDEVGRLAGAFDSMRSDLQAARDDLAARERFLSGVLDRVTVGVAVFAEEDEAVVLNPAGTAIVADFLPGTEAKAGAALLLAAFRARAARVHAADPAGFELVSEDGRRTLRGALAPLELPDGRTDTMLVFEDVTEFLTNKKMALNAELTRQVAHEIKNPLTPIQLSVQLLGQAWRDEHPQLDRIVPDTVERVLQQVDLLRSIASEFSLLGRPGELETEIIDLLSVVRDVAGSYVLEDAGGRVDIDTRALPPVRAHRESLLKILGNLMQNSLDAARSGVPLEVDIGWRIGDEQLALVWRDNGSGLPAEVADKLFDPYFSTKSKGTGLGLVICQNLADRMGGRITLANRDDGPGAVAELVLPRAANERNKDDR